jgi:hypothetical protein
VRDAALEAAGRPGVVTLPTEGVHPGDAFVSGPVLLLHVRGDARPGRTGGRAPYLSPDENLSIAAEGAGWAAWKCWSPWGTGPRTGGPRRGPARQDDANWFTAVERRVHPHHDRLAHSEESPRGSHRVADRPLRTGGWPRAALAEPLGHDHRDGTGDGEGG